MTDWPDYPIFKVKTVTPEAEEYFAHLWKKHEEPKPTRFPTQPVGSRGLSKPVVIACFEEGLTHAETAERIGVSVEAVARFTKRFDLGGVA